jgi:hypothetical protein
VAKEEIIMCGSSWVDYNDFIKFISGEKQIAMSDALEEHPDLNHPKKSSQFAKTIIIFVFAVFWWTLSWR